ncbi:unnamed protein product, partial [Rotaria magnacalcarata]
QKYKDTMSTDIITTLTVITFQMNRYLTIFILFFGAFGNVISLLIFYQTKHRTNPCAVYFFYTSAAGRIALYSGLLSRFFAGFSLDRSATDATICKLRAFIVWVSATASSWYITYATVDRYCISCREVRLRNLSNLRYTRRAMINTVVGASTVFAETFYCYVPNLRNSPLTCYAQNMVCRFYNETASALIFFFIPSTIMFIFGYASILNVKKLHYSIAPVASTNGTVMTMKKTDRQLIHMLIAQVILLTIFNIPLAAQRLYVTSTLNSAKTLLRSTIENLYF